MKWVSVVIPLIIGQIVSKNVIGFIDNPWFNLYGLFGLLTSKPRFEINHN